MKKLHKKVQICVICGSKQLHIFSYKDFHYYRCTKCELVSTYPLADIIATEKHYASRYKKGNYQLLRRFSKQYLSVYGQFVAILENKLTEQNRNMKGIKVLDVGCFTGDFLKLLQDKQADVYGVELQNEAVKTANKQLHGRVSKADITTYKFSKKKYDIITLLGLVEHVPDPLSLLKSSYKLLNKNGIIMIQTPNSGSFLAKTMRKFWPPFSPVEHVHLFSRKSLEEALKKQGFRDITFTPHRKRLPIGYVYNMFNNFGPEFYSLLKPLDASLNNSNIVLPFYIGEMIVTAVKK
jgi:2-polyprenyl-3-methyl-5-hydroxy-6-metoxy-1,4-benzoquinol methylase